MRKRILVVEDEEDNMQILRDLLAPGYELVEADNGEKALAEAAKQRPDLILMDIQLADHGRLRGDAPPQGRPGAAFGADHRDHVLRAGPR